MAAELVEAMNMVKSFRVSDLQTLLASMGRSKSGLKQDLVGRALRLVQTEYSPELLKNVRQLYESRFPKTSGWLAARRPEGIPVAYSPLSSSPSATSQGTDYLNGISKPIPTPAAEVKLVPLPFYQTLETLLPPTELIAQNNEKLQDSQCIFELTPNQADQIRNASELRPGIRSIQVVLRICYTDSIGVQEDQYPPNIAVKVNQSYCHVPGYYPSNKPGVEPRRPCRPVNITPWLHLSNVTNRITITWGNFGKIPSNTTASWDMKFLENFMCPTQLYMRYSVAVYLVRVFTAADLFSQLKLCSVESAERCRERIQDKLRFDPESEIATTGLRVSLICPLVKMRLGVPCRVLTCAHLQCFDAVFFLQMNEKKPTWTCPVCDKPAPFELLTIDGSISAADRKRLEKLVRNASSVLGMFLDLVQEMGEKRMVAKLLSLLENDSHPLYDTVTSQSSTFRDRLLHLKCLKDRYQRLLSEILKETSEDIEEIEYLTDGSWQPIRDEKEKDRERERSNTPEYPVVDICIPEANGHSPAHSSTSLTGKSGSSSVGMAGVTGGPAGTPGGGAVVDLTLDSSSEEEGGGAGGDSEDTEDSADSPAPKRGRYNYDKDLVTAY